MTNREDEFLAALNQIGAKSDKPGTKTQEAPVNPEEPLKNFSIKRAFSYQKTHPLILDMLLLNKYGPEWLTWEPETLWHEIEDDFDVNSISVHSRNKINALKCLHVVGSPWTEWEVFSIVCQALTNNIPDFRVFQKPSLDRIISAIDIMSKIKKKEFSEEVGRFIAACALDDGIIYTPAPIDFAQMYAASPQYKCKACGNIDIEEGNNRCDSCGAPQTSLEFSYKRDFRSTRDRYKKVMSDGNQRDYALEETEEDVQVAKLLRAKMTSEQFDERFSKQAEVLNA